MLTPNKKPLITMLAFSGGGASTALLSMVLDGTIPRPPNFHVVVADPGMEDPRTYVIVDRMEEKCLASGVPFHRAEGPNLAQDLLDPNRTRTDFPPYWTVDEKGKRGRLLQRCTQAYKIRPMDRVVRRILEIDHGIPSNRKRLGENIVEKWIGFTIDESRRCSVAQHKYQYFRYPLIDRGYTRDDLLQYYADKYMDPPPRSVCVACFANGAKHFIEMASERPESFDLACRIDEAIRDSRHLGVRYPCYVSRSCVPLRELVTDDFDIELGELCNSGMCMT